MKKLLTVVFTMLLAGSLSFAQAAGSDKTAPTDTKSSASGKKAKTSKAKKGSKKSKKNDTTAQPTK